MNTIGSHPGAILFRMSLMMILIAILIAIFLSYLEDNQKAIERQSVIQTKKIIDSSLAVVFADYAVNRRLADLNELQGANPFEFLREFDLLPPAYRGEIESETTVDTAPGWYYLRHSREIVYKPFYAERNIYYRVRLDFDDTNANGRFEPRVDRFRSLSFEEKI